MGRALLILGWLATVGLLSAGLLGFQVTPESGVGLHLLVALFSSLMILFSHSWNLLCRSAVPGANRGEDAAPTVRVISVAG